MTNNKYKSYITYSYKGTELLAKIVQVLLILCGVMLLAQWSWQIVMPAPMSLLPQAKVNRNEMLDTITTSHWFSAGSNHQTSLQPVVNFKLVGIFAPSKTSNGFAIIKMPDGKQSVVMQHEEITPGTRLLSLSANSINISYNGDNREIELETQSTRKPPTREPLHQPR